jgi:site-specific recombinase
MKTWPTRIETGFTGWTGWTYRFGFSILSILSNFRLGCALGLTDDFGDFSVANPQLNVVNVIMSAAKN